MSVPPPRHAGPRTEAARNGARPATTTLVPVPFREALRFWARLGFISFGGPAGQIAILHREIVERRKWLTEEEYLRALNFCMLLPGPEAQQLVTWSGWRLHGARGGIAAGSLFVLPSVFILLALSWLAARHAEVPLVAAAFSGIAAVVVSIVLEAVLRIGRRALTHPALLLFSAGAFAALLLADAPFPLVIGGAAAGGALLGRFAPRLFDRPPPRPAGRPKLPAAPAPDRPPGTAPPSSVLPQGPECDAAGAPSPLPARSGCDTPSAAPGPAGPESASPHPRLGPELARLTRLLLVFGGLWALPAGAVFLVRPPGDVLRELVAFFTKAAFVTFGGAYSVLTYISDAAVGHFGWLDAGEMVRGLGLAETTPGPLIMVNQYVGFLAGWNHPGGAPPLATAVAGALLVTWVTFLPSFFFIFAGAPWIEVLSRNPRLRHALAGVTAAVVGVIARLALTFGLQVLVRPDGSPDLPALALAAAGFVALARFRVPVHLLVAAAALAGIAAWLVGG